MTRKTVVTSSINIYNSELNTKKESVEETLLDYIEANRNNE